MSNSAAHESACTVDGFFRTSDNAKIDSNAYLFLTGRGTSTYNSSFVYEQLFSSFFLLKKGHISRNSLFYVC